MLPLISAMNRQQVKFILATFLAAMLLYYNAAWALLRCCHVGEHASVADIISTNDLHDRFDRHPSRPSPAPSQIDCLDFDHQLEVLAGPSAPPQLHRGAAARTPHGNDVIVLKSLAGGHGKNLCMNTFTRGSPLAEPPNPPLYISFSNLRI